MPPRTFHHMKFMVNKKLPTRETTTTDNSQPDISLLEQFPSMQFQLMTISTRTISSQTILNKVFLRTVFFGPFHQSCFCLESLSSFQEKHSFYIKYINIYLM